MLFSSVSILGIFTGSDVAVLGMTCIMPTAPTGLFTFWSNLDSW